MSKPDEPKQVPYLQLVREPTDSKYQGPNRYDDTLEGMKKKARELDFSGDFDAASRAIFQLAREMDEIEE